MVSSELSVVSARRRFAWGPRTVRRLKTTKTPGSSAISKPKSKNTANGLHSITIENSNSYVAILAEAIALKSI